MKLLIHDGLQNPQTIKATRVVVLDELDNPVAVAVEVDRGVIIAETASEENQAEFNAILRNLGIDKTVAVTDAKERPLPEIHIPGSPEC